MEPKTKEELYESAKIEVGFLLATLSNWEKTIRPIVEKVGNACQKSPLKSIEKFTSLPLKI